MSRSAVRSRPSDANLPIPVVLCLDVEPDEREVARGPRPWLGFERLVDRIETIRLELAARTGRAVQFSWFLRMDPQIAQSHGRSGWVADHYGDELHALRAAGDVIGVHPHAWRWVPGRDRWVADHADPNWVDHCLRVSLETYEAAMGEPCRASRAGDRFVSARTVRLAAELGVHYDLSVEPGGYGARGLHRGIPATGHIPSGAGAPLVPYRPSTADPMRPADEQTPGDDAGLWMIPLTALDPAPILPAWQRIGRRIRHPGRPGRRTAALYMPWPAQGFWGIIRRDLEGSDRPYLAFAVRSDAFVRPAIQTLIVDKLAVLTASPLVQRLAFTTPEALVAETR